MADLYIVKGKNINVKNRFRVALNSTETTKPQLHMSSAYWMSIR